MSCKFGEALEMLKAGKKVTRHGWNGKGMWLEMVWNKNTMYKEYPVLPWIGMKTADGCFVPWLASQTDLIQEDWCEEL